MEADIVPVTESRHYNLTPRTSPLSSVTSTSSATESTLTLQSTPSPTEESTMSVPTIPMPARGDRSAPRFDPHQPRELKRYFADLDFAFVRAGITDATEKKKHACRFVDVDTADLWESISEYSDAQKSYAEFVLVVYSLYPGAEEERKWSVADMDKLVGERSRLGVLSLGDLGDYYRQFYTITTFLISKQRLSAAEQSRAFVRGFQPDLWSRISQRLQLKLPDHFPDDPYDLERIHEAAQFVLHGTPSTLLVTSPSPIPPAGSTSSTSTSTSNNVKVEDIATIIERITESFVKALSAQNNVARNSAPTDRPSRPPNSNPNPGCNYCGSLEHFIRDCQVVLEDIKQGKCQRNVEGRVTLPSGAFVPRDIPGRYFKDRIEEWHRRNPGQQAASQMLYHVLSNGISEIASTSQAKVDIVPTSIATRISHPDLFTSQIEPDTQLSTNDRIASLERELFQLRGRKFEPVVRTRSQRAADRGKHRERSRSPVDREPSVEIEEEPARPPKKRALQPEVVIPVAAPSKPKPTPERPATPPRSEPPIHPYAEARDATYAVPQHRNFGALPKPAPPKKPEPAYRTLPPIYDGQIAVDVYDRAMATSVMLTQRELLSLSPEVRSQVREATSAKRTTTKEGNAKEIHTYAEDDNLAAAIDDIEPGEPQYRLPTSTFINSIYQSKTPPPGSLIIPDPYETYLKTLPIGAIPDRLIVAKESSALRSIFPLVDHQRHVEAILDPGSQIIAMAEEVCFDLGLIYDPSVVLNMQSANGEVDQSLGLSRNVPVQIGEITLYVQIHVIRSPAYDILLGRPFDILTESVVRNFANEEQTVTIFDPNSGRRATVPTSARGRPRRPVQKQAFITSMN